MIDIILHDLHDFHEIHPLCSLSSSLAPAMCLSTHLSALCVCLTWEISSESFNSTLKFSTFSQPLPLFFSTLGFSQPLIFLNPWYFSTLDIFHFLPFYLTFSRELWPDNKSNTQRVCCGGGDGGYSSFVTLELTSPHVAIHSDFGNSLGLFFLSFWIFGIFLTFFFLF